MPKMPKSVQSRSEPDFSRGGKGIRKTRKNRKIGFGPFFNRNLLSINSFRLKWATGILRIIRNFLRVGVWGPLGKMLKANAKVMKNRASPGKPNVRLFPRTSGYFRIFPGFGLARRQAGCRQVGFFLSIALAGVLSLNWAAVSKRVALEGAAELFLKLCHSIEVCAQRAPLAPSAMS
jgi:hypothetical protein